MSKEGEGRRDFLSKIARFVILWGAIGGFERVSHSSSNFSRGRPFPKELEAWIGKAFEYSAGCPIVEDFAWGHIRIQRVGSERLFIVMETRLQGIAGLVSLHRSDTLASLVTWMGSHGRFVPLWHADQVARKGSWRRKVLIFEQGGTSSTEWRLSPDGARSRRLPGQGRLLDDPLSALLNWRAGAYGPLRPGEAFLIDNLARKEPLVIRLQVLPEQESRKSKPPEREDWAFLIRAQVEREVAQSVRGSLEGWVDQQWVPVFARARDVRIVGEAWARLTGKFDLREKELGASPEPPLSVARWVI